MTSLKPFFFCFYLILLLLNTGCKSNGKGEDITYKKRELPLRVGYTDIQYDDETFKVIYHGSATTTMDIAYDFALLRAANIATEHGYQYFSIRIITKDTEVLRTKADYGTFTYYFPRVELDMFLFHAKEGSLRPIYSSENEIKRLNFKYKLKLPK